jgi:hypothetical protein
MGPDYHCMPSNGCAALAFYAGSAHDIAAESLPFGRTRIRRSPVSACNKRIVEVSSWRHNEPMARHTSSGDYMGRRLRNMRTTILSLLSVLMIWLTGCGGPEGEVTTQPPVVLSPDDAHNMASGNEGVSSYKIAACRSLRFDTKGYHIPVPEKLGVEGPNAIHLVHRAGEYYRIAWDGKSPVTLEAAALTNIRGSNTFAGFVSGETYMLAVGHDNFPQRDLKFSVMWAGMIEVK